MVNPEPVPDLCAPVRVQARIPKRLDDWLEQLADQSELPKSSVIANILLQAWAAQLRAAEAP